MKFTACFVFSSLLFSGGVLAHIPKTLPLKADKIVVEKHKRVMSVYHQDKKIKHYPIALGFNPIGTKIKEGDGKTPEGRYRITYKNPQSRFHLSLALSYPSEQDRQRANALGVKPGGNIVIHGVGKALTQRGDWTHGCIAVTNQEMDEIFHMAQVGTEVHILP